MNSLTSGEKQSLEKDTFRLFCMNTSTCCPAFGAAIYFCSLTDLLLSLPRGAINAVVNDSFSGNAHLKQPSKTTRSRLASPKTKISLYGLCLPSCLTSASPGNVDEKIFTLFTFPFSTEMRRKFLI